MRENYDTGHFKSGGAVNTRGADCACIYGDGVARPAAGYLKVIYDIRRSHWRRGGGGIG